MSRSETQCTFEHHLCKWQQEYPMDINVPLASEANEVTFAALCCKSETCLYLVWVLYFLTAMHKLIFTGVCWHFQNSYVWDLARHITLRIGFNNWTFWSLVDQLTVHTEPLCGYSSYIYLFFISRLYSSQPNSIIIVYCESWNQWVLCGT